MLLLRIKNDETLFTVQDSNFVCIVTPLGTHVSAEEGDSKTAKEQY